MSAADHADKRLILLVDDDILILGLLSKFLQLAGYDARMASSGQMALDMILESGREPDLALLDVNMPGMSGLELAKRLQSDTTVPVMFLSASDDDDIVRQAAQYGAVGYLVKPIDTARIAPTIKAALARADEIRQLRQSESKLTMALQAGRETGMAVGVLMARLHTDRDTAFRLLRDHARSQQRKINDVAGQLLAAEEVFGALTSRFIETQHGKP
jgi:DNA-binding response OmpR family regulator